MVLHMVAGRIRIENMCECLVHRNISVKNVFVAYCVYTCVCARCAIENTLAKKVRGKMSRCSDEKKRKPW